MSFLHDTPLMGLVLCGSTGFGCPGLAQRGNDDAREEMLSIIVDCEGLSFGAQKPLWLLQAEEDNERKAAMESDSDDNYSYDDDEADQVERSTAFVRMESIAFNSNGGVPPPPERQFDVEWHSLLTELGNVEDSSLDECILRHEFEAMDSDGNGCLDVSELAVVFEKLGIGVKPYKLANLMMLADEDGSGTIEWPEFAKMVKLGIKWNSLLKDLGAGVAKKRGPVLEYQLKKEFAKIDADGNGSLDAEELKMLFDNLKIPIDMGMIIQLVSMADKDGNGTIEWEEFRKMFHVVNTVARLTRPKKKAKAQEKRLPPRQSTIEWQALIAQVGAKIQQRKVPVDEKSLRKEFDRIDTSGDGSLDVSELMQAFSQMGISLDKGKVENIVEMADEDGSKTIEWREFKRMFDVSVQWHELVMKLGKSLAGAGPLNDTVLRRQFCTIDKDNNGSLDKDELREVFANLKIDIDEATLGKLLTLADGDGSDAIEWPEFKRVFQVVRCVASSTESQFSTDARKGAAPSSKQRHR